jgi:hypothetical protein
VVVSGRWYTHTHTHIHTHIHMRERERERARERERERERERPLDFASPSSHAQQPPRRRRREAGTLMPPPRQGAGGVGVSFSPGVRASFLTPACERCHCWPGQMILKSPLCTQVVFYVPLKQFFMTPKTVFMYLYVPRQGTVPWLFS